MSDRIFMLADEAGVAAGGGLAVPAWLPWGLVAGGVVLLACVAAMLVRGRASGATAEGGAAGRARAAAELTDLKNQLVEVKKLAATVADDLDRRAERLERLIAQADDMIGRGEGESGAGGAGGRGAVAGNVGWSDARGATFRLLPSTIWRSGCLRWRIRDGRRCRSRRPFGNRWEMWS